MSERSGPGVDTGITIDRRGPICTVTLDRPLTLNAIDRDMHRDLVTIWRSLLEDEESRAVVLTGAGGAFSAGGDLRFVEDVDRDPVLRAAVLREAQEIIEEVLRFPLPLIVAIEGPAVGLGCSLAMLADVVIMGEDAYLADPHVAIGLVAGDGGAAVWPLLASPLKVKKLLWTGERIPAREADRIGMATSVVPTGDALAEARSVAQRIAALPPQAVQGTKQAVNLHLRKGVAGVLEFAAAAEGMTISSDDHQRLVQHLLERSRSKEVR